MKRGDVVIFAAKFEAKVEISTERWMNALHSDSRLSVQQGRCAENRFRPDRRPSAENQQTAIQNGLERLKHSQEHSSDPTLTSANRPENRSGDSSMKSVLSACLFALLVISGSFTRAEITVISCSEAKRLIDNPKESDRPIVIDTRGGYKDYFRAHIPTAHHLNFDTLRGTDLGVPVQYSARRLDQSSLNSCWSRQK